MAQVTGTLAGLNDMLSDAPTDLNTIKLRVAMIAVAAQTLAETITAKCNASPDGSLDAATDDQSAKMLAALNGELELLLAAKQRIERKPH